MLWVKPQWQHINYYIVTTLPWLLKVNGKGGELKYNAMLIILFNPSLDFPYFSFKQLRVNILIF